MAPNAAPDVAPLLGKDRKSPLSPPVQRHSNPIAILIMIVMLILIGAGVYRNVSRPAAVQDVVKVVGAGADIAPGARINYHSLHYITIPKEYFAEDMMSTSSEAVGRIAKVFIGRGEPVTQSALLPANQTLSGLVETHERAISLKLDDDGLLDHNLYPGDVVDVVVTTTKDSKKYTKTICQQVRVLMCLTRDALASNQIRTDDRNKITLAVSPEQAEMLSQAQETGKVRLVLRNRLSTVVPRLAGVGENDLLPGKAFVPAPETQQMVPAAIPALLPPAPPPLFSAPPAPPLYLPKDPLKWVVEVFSGSKRETHEFSHTSP
ncbi:MAG TPA: Flp pilus assembly protein CpaB [Candidatus Obscuribacterales bacterium]